ncbi:MAG: NUDIX hydrolase [Acutalibacteraceae bacterium]
MENSTHCYIEKDGKWLMLHRVKKENDINRDKWIGVGGHFEFGESPEECVIREIKEETGLDVKCPEYRGIVTFISDDYCEYMHLFIAKKFSGVLTECKEGKLEWVEKKKINRLNIWEGDMYFNELLQKDVPFFSMKLVYESEKLKSVILNGEKIK